MEKHFEYLQNIRDNYFKLLKTFSEEELHLIPAGFNNNIFWNVGHIIATQQAVCYLLSKATPAIPMEFIKDFRKGTAPTEEYKVKYNSELLKEYLQLTSEKIKDDYHLLKDLEFQPYTTSFGTSFKTVEDAIIFNNIHEGVHYGYILSLKNNLK